jgi:hypothetical protein
MDTLDPRSAEADGAIALFGVALVAVNALYHCSWCGLWVEIERLGDGTLEEHYLDGTE